MGPGCGCDNNDVVNVVQMEQRGGVTPASEGVFTGSKFVMINIYKVTQEKVAHCFLFVLLSILLLLVCRRVETTKLLQICGRDQAPVQRAESYQRDFPSMGPIQCLIQDSCC